MPKMLVVTPDRDQQTGDWSGAFSVEARRLVELHRLPGQARLSINLGGSSWRRREQLVAALQKQNDLDLVAFLCHGWKSGIQLGWTVQDLAQLAGALKGAGAPGLKVVLYACSTAKDLPAAPGTAGDGGFADRLRDELRLIWPEWSGWVDAHDRAGHCCSNPYVRRMLSSEAKGGAFLVEPNSARWGTWQRRLRDRDNDTLRLRFPQLSRGDLDVELRA